MASAGARLGDIIVAIDGKATAGVSRETAQRLISGPPQSVVRLSLLRTGEAEVARAEARRGLIIPRTVRMTVDGDIGRIEISSFNMRTSADVSAAVAEMKARNVRGLVLDLRNDPGGLLDQGVEIADLFLSVGVITTLDGRHPGAKQHYEARPGDIAEGLPMIVLIDGKSASASEIVAAALADNGRAVTVGTNTLGKGSVQTLIRLPNDGEMALTWSQAWSPDGYRIHELGVLPSVCTSGFTGPMAEMVGATFRDRAQNAGDREAWRTPVKDAESRKALRALCPAESRPDRTVDVLVAERLVSDPAFYARAVATSVAAAR
jgi:carboxyl-terminal processing protease